MQTDKQNNPDKRQHQTEQEAERSVTGGAIPAGNNQLLDEKAEKYLRESGNIEDLPGEEDQQELDDAAGRSKPA